MVPPPNWSCKYRTKLFCIIICARCLQQFSCVWCEIWLKLLLCNQSYPMNYISMLNDILEKEYLCGMHCCTLWLYSPYIQDIVCMLKAKLQDIETPCSTSYGVSYKAERMNVPRRNGSVCNGLAYLSQFLVWITSVALTKEIILILAPRELLTNGVFGDSL